MSAPRRSTEAYRGADTVAPQRPFRLGATFVPDPEPELSAGTLVGAQERYRIEGFLGQGGMGRVYAALRLRDRRPAAVKVLRADRVGDNAAELTARFRQEAEAASRAGHKGIVETFGFEQTPDGRALLAMELLEGETLEAWLARPGQLRDALVIIADICEALDAAHVAGVVHRDLKPANLFLHREADGTVRPTVLDFGLAKLSVSDHTQIETAAGTVLGTPYYLAPERALGRRVDARSDLYSMGVILYEVVVGALPFEDDNFMAIVEGHVRRTPLDPRQAAPGRKTPDPIAALTMALLSKDPAHRPESAAVVALTLRELLASHADAIGECATGPGASVSTDAETLSVVRVAGWATAAPTDMAAPTELPAPTNVDPRAQAATMIPREALRAPPAPRRGPWPWLAAGGAALLVAVGVGVVLRQDATPPASQTADTQRVESPAPGGSPRGEVVETEDGATPRVAQPSRSEPVVERAVPRSRPSAESDAVPSQPPRARKTTSGGGTTRKSRGSRRPQSTPDAAPAQAPALPAFKDQVYDEP